MGGWPRRGGGASRGRRLSFHHHCYIPRAPPPSLFPRPFRRCHAVFVVMIVVIATSPLVVVLIVEARAVLTAVVTAGFNAKAVVAVVPPSSEQTWPVVPSPTSSSTLQPLLHRCSLRWKCVHIPVKFRSLHRRADPFPLQRIILLVRPHHLCCRCCCCCRRRRGSSRSVERENYCLSFQSSVI